MSKLTVITGAAGFIGRNVAAALNGRGNDNLLLVDRLGSDEKWRNLIGLRYEDILDPDEFLTRTASGQLRGVETLIHLGACSATTERDADFLLQNNYRYTRTLCEWCLETGARFVYASSAATYGDGGLGYSDDDATTPLLRPLNMYGYSKHLFDLWALRHGLFDHIVGLKYFNVFGPYEDHKGDMRSVVHKAYHEVKQTGVASLFRSHHPGYADGEQKRDFIYVKDAAKVTLFFAEQQAGGGLFNCGTGRAHTWKDLVTAIFDALRLQPDIRFIEMPEALRRRYQYYTQAEPARLRNAGYRAAFTPLAEAVTDYVRYLEERNA